MHSFKKKNHIFLKMVFHGIDDMYCNFLKYYAFLYIITNQNSKMYWNFAH